LKLKKVGEVEQEFMKNNNESVRPRENKANHECEIIKRKVSAIRNRIEEFGEKNMGKAETERK
jgi:hypothetical protein